MSVFHITDAADRDAVAKALLRSFDFLECGFSARRPLGCNSLIAKDVLVAIGRDEDGDLQYADAVWREMPAYLPKFIDRLLADHATVDSMGQNQTGAADLSLPKRDP